MYPNIMRRSIIFASLLLPLMLALGCGGEKTPIAPDMNSPLTVAAESASATSRVLWGFYEVEIDPATLKVSVIPLRGAMFTANVTQFMQPPFSPTNMLAISIDFGGSDIPSNLFAVDVTLRHPFPGLAQFRGFDVRGIFMADASMSAGFDPTVEYANWFDAAPGVPTSESVLLNADGYTRWWNPSEFTSFDTIFGYTQGAFASPGFTAGATVNPFKYFADGLDFDDPFEIDPSTRGTFGVDPGINTRRYLIQFDETPLEFNYGIDAGWESPDPAGAPEYEIDSFSLSANCREAYKVTLSDAGSDAWYEDADSSGGSFLVEIEVFDWQAQGASINPSTVLDEVAAVWLESSAFDDGGGNNYVNVLTGDFELLPGSGDTSAVFRVQVDASFGPGEIDAAGSYPVFIAIESSDPDTYEPQAPGGDAFDYPNAPLAAFATGIVEVLPENPNPIPDVVLVFDPTTEFEPFNYDGDASAPAICVEKDDEIAVAYREYRPYPTYNWSWTVTLLSQDDGASWTDSNSSFTTTGSGWIIDTIKVWPTSHNISYKTMNVGNNIGQIFLGSTNSNFPGPGPTGYEVASRSHNCDYANEIAQDGDGYVYLFGDKDDTLRFKRSPVPECLNCAPPPPPPYYSDWSYVEEHTMVSPGRLSWIRSSVLYDGTIYLAYFEPDNNTIRLARSTGDWLVWDTSEIIWDGSGSDTSEARDPGLIVDETGFHATFVRTDDSTGHYQLCYVYSADGDAWSDPVVVHDAVEEIIDTPICRYDWEDWSVLATVWWEDNDVWSSFSLDEGATWCDPILVGEISSQNKHADLVIASTGNWHFVFTEHSGIGDLYELRYRRAHLEYE